MKKIASQISRRLKDISGFSTVAKPSLQRELRLRAHWLFAKFFGYFWLPCCGCGQWFGGHQIARIVRHDLFTAVWHEPAGIGIVLCPLCCHSATRRDPEVPVKVIALADGFNSIVETGCLAETTDGKVIGVGVRRDPFWSLLDVILTVFICALCGAMLLGQGRNRTIYAAMIGVWTVKLLMMRTMALPRASVAFILAIAAWWLFLIWLYVGYFKGS